MERNLPREVDKVPGGLYTGRPFAKTDQLPVFAPPSSGNFTETNPDVIRDKDISSILEAWNYKPGELIVRAIDGSGRRRKIQIRVDLGLMQLEWTDRPDGSRPHNSRSLLSYYQNKLREAVRGEGKRGFSLSREDCWALSREAMQYYWRRISFFELKEYERAEEDAEHNLGILDMCKQYAEHDEDRRISDQYRVFVTTHRIQARALQMLEEKEHEEALQEIRGGIEEIEQFLEAQEEPGSDECEELQFLRKWEKEVEGNRPLSRRERLDADLRAAVEEEKFELAASLRDKLRRLRD